MNSESLRVLADAHGPFVSVYLPSDVGSPWPLLRRTLAAQDTHPEVLAALDEVLLHSATQGDRGLIATGDGVLVDSPLAWSTPAPVARLSDLPYLLPLAPRHAVRAPEMSLVAAGHADDASALVPGDRTVFDQFMFETSRPDGPVVQGVRQCAAALREGNVDALVVIEGAIGDRSVWVGGPHRDQVADEEAELRALGMPVSRERADEALPMAALTIGAALLVAPADIPLADGVGVLLRHP